MISIIIPAFNTHEYTARLLDSLYENSVTELEIIIIDNGSKTPFHYSFPESTINHRHRFIKNKKNIGAFPAIQQGFEIANGDYLAFLHSDLIIHEYAWDERVETVFENDESIALAGFFGSKAINLHGDKIETLSNLLGLETGESWEKHSGHFTGETEVISLDSMAMIFRKEHLDKIDMSDLPPHHWFDRIITMRYFDAGYKTMLIGIGFDHQSKSTYTIHNDEFEEFCKEWCEKRGIGIDLPKHPGNDKWNLALAAYGKGLWLDLWKPKLIKKILESDGSYNLNEPIERVADATNDGYIVKEWNVNAYL